MDKIELKNLSNTNQKRGATMGLRFRKSVKIAPGIRVNFGKKGSSLSIGGRGATVNISKKGQEQLLEFRAPACLTANTKNIIPAPKRSH